MTASGRRRARESARSCFVALALGFLLGGSGCTMQKCVMGAMPGKKHMMGKKPMMKKPMMKKKS